MKDQPNNWILLPDKFLTQEQASHLLRTTQRFMTSCKPERRNCAIRDYLAIDLLLNTGLRVTELANLDCGDLFLDNPLSWLLVRHGKGNKRRLVFFTGPIRKHCLEYLSWKESIGESIDDDAPLLQSCITGKHMCRRALQNVFKRCARRSGLPAKLSIHCLRHTYACLLLKASNWNLRFVQKQLGHASITTTQIYADIMMPDIEIALNKLHY